MGIDLQGYTYSQDGHMGYGSFYIFRMHLAKHIGGNIAKAWDMICNWMSLSDQEEEEFKRIEDKIKNADEGMHRLMFSPDCENNEYDESDTERVRCILERYRDKYMSDANEGHRWAFEVVEKVFNASQIVRTG